MSQENNKEENPSSTLSLSSLENISTSQSDLLPDSNVEKGETSSSSSSAFEKKKEDDPEEEAYPCLVRNHSKSIYFLLFFFFIIIIISIVLSFAFYI